MGGGFQEREKEGGAGGGRGVRSHYRMKGKELKWRGSKADMRKRKEKGRDLDGSKAEDVCMIETLQWMEKNSTGVEAKVGKDERKEPTREPQPAGTLADCWNGMCTINCSNCDEHTCHRLLYLFSLVTHRPSFSRFGREAEFAPREK